MTGPLKDVTPVQPAHASPPAVSRRISHARKIHCIGFERDDGWFDIEGTLTDTKPIPLAMPERGPVAPGEPIHEMTLRITIDRAFVIHDACAWTLHSPYRICGEINDSYRQIIGLTIAAGFTQTVKRLFRGTQGCSHLTELLPTMATTAFQVLWSSLEAFDGHDPGDPAARGATPLGGCHALRQDGDVVRVHFPQHYRARPSLDSKPS